MPTYHIVNGDNLAQQLEQIALEHHILVCRECLIDGNVWAENISEFWKLRASHIAATYNSSESDYFNKVVNEFERISSIPDNAEVHLWFGNDLFCQVNMWFVLSLLSANPTLKIYRIFPTKSDAFETCKGFATSDSALLQECLDTRILCKPEDIALGKNLWLAYQQNDGDKFTTLSTANSDCFRNLPEVCQAHIDRSPNDGSVGRPERIVREILQTTTNFQEVFTEFSRRESIYGFGDSQLYTIYKQCLNSL